MYDQGAAPLNLSVRLSQAAKLLSTTDERAIRCGRFSAGSGQLRSSQTIPDLFGRGPLLWIAREQAQAERPQVFGHFRIEGAWIGRIQSALLPQDIRPAPFKRQPAGQRRKQDHAHCVPIAGGGQRFSGGLLGRHERRGAGSRAIGGFDPAAAVLQQRIEIACRQAGAKPKIENDHPAALFDHDVGRLQVAVQDSPSVQGDHSRGQLPVAVAQQGVIQIAGLRPVRRDLELRLIGIERGVGQPLRCRRQQFLPALRRPADMGDKVRPVHKLHREEPLLRQRQQLIQGNQIGMSNLRQTTKLILEVIQAFRIDIRQHLKRYDLVPLAVERGMNEAHSPGTEQPDQKKPLRAEKTAYPASCCRPPLDIRQVQPGCLNGKTSQ